MQKTGSLIAVVARLVLKSGRMIDEILVFVMSPAQIFTRAALFTAMIATAGQAETIRLKSGAKGELAAGFFNEFASGGDDAVSSMIELKVILEPGAAFNPDTDAHSVCVLYRVRSFEAIKANEDLRTAMKDFIDVDAPLSVVRVRFEFGEAARDLVAMYYDFDMRGIVKCRPLS